MVVDVSRAATLLSKNLKIQSVQGLPDFPCVDYSDFLSGYRGGRIKVLTAFSANVASALGTPTSKTIYYVLTNSPFIISLALIVIAVMLNDYWLLFGIPAAVLGFMFATPAIEKAFGKNVFWIVLIAGAGSWFAGNRGAAWVAASYLLSNYFVAVAYAQNDQLIREAIQESELVLIWLFLQKSVVIRKKT